MLPARTRSGIKNEPLQDTWASGSSNGAITTWVPTEVVSTSQQEVTSLQASREKKRKIVMKDLERLDCDSIACDLLSEQKAVINLTFPFKELLFPVQFFGSVRPCLALPSWPRVT